MKACEKNESIFSDGNLHRYRASQEEMPALWWDTDGASPNQRERCLQVLQPACPGN
jgi:hypothetical protein